MSKRKSLTKRYEATLASALFRDPVLNQAMDDAHDILSWSRGPNVAGWRVYRLALALVEKDRKHA